MQIYVILKKFLKKISKKEVYILILYIENKNLYELKRFALRDSVGALYFL